MLALHLCCGLEESVPWWAAPSSRAAGASAGMSKVARWGRHARLHSARGRYGGAPRRLWPHDQATEEPVRFPADLVSHGSEQNGAELCVEGAANERARCL